MTGWALMSSCWYPLILRVHISPAPWPGTQADFDISHLLLCSAPACSFCLMVATDCLRLEMVLGCLVPFWQSSAVGAPRKTFFQAFTGGASFCRMSWSSTFILSLGWYYLNGMFTCLSVLLCTCTRTCACLRACGGGGGGSFYVLFSIWLNLIIRYNSTFNILHRPHTHTHTHTQMSSMYTCPHTHAHTVLINTFSHTVLTWTHSHTHSKHGHTQMSSIFRLFVLSCPSSLVSADAAWHCQRHGDAILSLDSAYVLSVSHPALEGFRTHAMTYCFMSTKWCLRFLSQRVAAEPSDVSASIRIPHPSRGRGGDYHYH